MKWDTRKQKAAFYSSLDRLNTDYLDMYLIHWPASGVDYVDWRTLNAETWRAMEELYDEGRIKALGVSNFLPHHLDALLESCKIKPAVDQIEFHPGYTQEATVQYCREHEILVQAWSPMGRMRVLQEPLIGEMARKYAVSPAQLCLRFSVQRGIIPLPKSSTMERMKENQELFDFEISSEDMHRLNTLPQVGWSGEHPDRKRVMVKEA